MSDLESILIPRTADDKIPTQWVSWSDEGPDFEVLALGEDLLDEIRKESVDPDQPTRIEKERGFRPKKVPNVKDEIVGRNTLRRVIKGWRRFEYRMLAELVDPEKVKVSLNGKERDAELGFSAESLDMLALYASLWFREFISQGAVGCAAKLEEKNSEQVGNSQSTSGGN